MVISRLTKGKKGGGTPFVSRGAPYFFIFPALLATFFVAIFPVVYGLVLSFTDRGLLQLNNSKFLGLKNYVEVFKDSNFWHSFRLQIVFIFIVIPVELVIGFFVALLFNRPLPFSRTLRSLLMLPVFVLPVLSGLTWRLMLQPSYGVLSSLFNLLSLGPSAWLADRKYAYIAVLLQDVWRMWPFMFMIIYAGLTSLPAELIDAANIDGAGFWKRTIYVVIPCLKPVLVTAILLRMIDALRIFSEVYVMTYGGPSNATMLLSLYIYRQAFEFGNISYASTLAIFLLTFSLLLAYMALKGGLHSQ